MELNVDERERAMEFMTCVTAASSFFKGVVPSSFGSEYGPKLLDLDCEFAYGQAMPSAH